MRMAPEVPIWTGWGLPWPSLAVLGWTLRCGGALNEGGHLICVIASKSTLDSSLDGRPYNADAELFLPRQVIR